MWEKVTRSSTLAPTDFRNLDYAFKYILAIDVIIALVICTSNSIVLAAFIKCPSLRQRHTMMSDLVINLAVSDLFHGAISIPWLMVPHYAIPQAKDNRVICVLSYMFFQYSTAVSLLIQLAIAIERYVAIVHPFWDVPKFLKCVLKKGVVFAIIWVYPAIGIGIMTAVNTVGKEWSWCEASVVLSTYHNAVIGAHLAIILVLASVLYAKIIRTVHRSGETVRRYSEGSKPSSHSLPSHYKRHQNASKKSNPTGQGESRFARLKKQMSKRMISISANDIQVIKTLGLLLVIFYVLFLPAIIKIVIHIAIGLPSPEPLWLNVFDQVILISMMLSSAIDPILYGWRNKPLRQVIQEMLLCHGDISRKSYSADEDVSPKSPSTRSVFYIEPTAPSEDVDMPVSGVSYIKTTAV